MTTVLSVVAVCITVLALAERYYRFKERLCKLEEHSRIKEAPLNVKELDEIKEEISKLKGRISANKIGKVMEL